MQSTPNPQQTDPHDVFVIEPDVSLAARADKAPLDVLYDVLRDHSRPGQADIERLDIKPSDVRLSNPASADSELRIAPDFSAAGEAPPPAGANGIKLGETEINAHQPTTSKFARRAVMGLFALGSAVCAAAWQHYGDDAKTMLAQWTPAFALASTPPLEKPATASQASASPVQAAVADQASAQSASPVQAVANAAPDPSQALQSMARDLAAMGQQISELKATIEQLKANQSQASQVQPAQAPVPPREPVRTEARLTEPTTPLVRPRIVMPPAHAAPVRKPKQVFPYAPIAAAPPPAAAAPVSQTAAAPAPAASQPQTAEDGGPVVRPPLPLH